jgi:hypothetical protein
MPSIVAALLFTLLWPPPAFQSSAINSPDAFVALIPKTNRAVDITNAWKQLGVAPGPFSTFYNDGQGVTKHTLDDDLVVVQVWEYNGPCRMVFFKRTAGNWHLSGIVDIRVERLEPVRVRLRQAGTRRWVELTSAESEGTGIFAHVVTWYDVTDRGVKKVLEYPGDGHLFAGDLFMPLGVGYAVKSTFRDITIQGRRAGIRVQLSVNFQYIGERDFKDLFPPTVETAIFHENLDGTFTLTPSPTLNSDKLSKLYFIARRELTAQEFLDLEFRQLQPIASGRDEEKKAWLRDFLDQCKEEKLCTDTKGIVVK